MVIAVSEVELATELKQNCSLRAKSRSVSLHERVSTSPDTSGIWDVLVEVLDPEVPVVSVVELGIVRSVTPDLVTITPTYTGCPATEVIERDVRAALDAAGYRRVAIETVLSPAWTTDWITPEGRAKLHAYGIAPPVPRGAAVACPQCGSSDTVEISRFGSTACKSLWRCTACREPFDHFKAI